MKLSMKGIQLQDHVQGLDHQATALIPFLEDVMHSATRESPVLMKVFVNLWPLT